MLYKDLMDKLMLGQDLTRAELERTIAGIMTQELTQVQVLGFQMAFLMKGPTPQELADYAHAMRANCTSIAKFRGDLAGRYEPAPGPCKLEGAIFTFDADAGTCRSVEQVALYD